MMQDGAAFREHAARFFAADLQQFMEDADAAGEEPAPGLEKVVYVLGSGKLGPGPVGLQGDDFLSVGQRVKPAAMRDERPEELDRALALGEDPRPDGAVQPVNPMAGRGSRPWSLTRRDAQRTPIIEILAVGL